MSEEEIKQAFKKIQEIEIEAAERDNQILMLIDKLVEKVSALEKLVKTN